jgi:hypothetical protein
MKKSLGRAKTNLFHTFLAVLDFFNPINQFFRQAWLESNIRCAGAVLTSKTSFA